ncbi:tRNA dihydrouridine synthase [Rhodosporidiobolus nylandii]
MTATASVGIGGHSTAHASTSEEGTAPTTADLEAQPESDHQKLQGYDLWKDMGEPKYIVAPMVDQSELAWRILSRIHGANLCYTPMFHAALFASQPKYQPEMFDLSPDSLEGVAPYDRPLIVQFCANDKDQWLAAAKKVEGRCDAVDLNLGCPQGIAKRGNYGAFLMEDWPRIRDMISHLHKNLSTPVIAKLRVFPSLTKTLQYAAHVYSSGAQIVAQHGRTREAKGQLAGFASWSKIKAVVDLLSPKVPVLANGGVPSAEEVGPCLAETGASGILSAEGNLYNPMIFSPENAAEGRAYLDKLPAEMQAAIKACEAELDASVPWDRDLAAYAPATFIAAQYLAIVRTLPSTKTALSAVKAHLYKLFRPVWAAGKHPEMREKLGRCGSGAGLSYEEKVLQYLAWNDAFRELLHADLAAGALPPSSNRPLTHAEVQSLYDGVIPYSHCQPYLRVSKPVEGTEEKELRSVDGEAKRKREVEEGTVADDLDPAKRLKPSPPSPSSAAVPTAVDPTAPAPSATPSTVSCVNSTATPKACANAAAAKCSNGACKACCASLRSAFSEGVKPCEFHEEKERKAAEQQAERKEAARLRKERGQQKMKENEAKNREAREKKRLAAEERKKKAGEAEAPVETKQE